MPSSKTDFAAKCQVVATEHLVPQRDGRWKTFVVAIPQAHDHCIVGLGVTVGDFQQGKVSLALLPKGTGLVDDR